MTLIAAVPCGRAFAIAADSQETDGDYRGAVQKISPVDLGGIKTIVAGSGNGDLIDSFIEKVSRRFLRETVESLYSAQRATTNRMGGETVKERNPKVLLCGDDSPAGNLGVDLYACSG